MPPEPQPDPAAPTPPAYFTQRWFADLLGARLSLGDTFWAGLFGTALFFVPAGFVLTFIAAVVSGPAGQALVSGLFAAVMAVFHIMLATAVFRTARRTPHVGVWRWLGVVFAIANAAAITVLVLSLLGPLFSPVSGGGPS